MKKLQTLAENVCRATLLAGLVCAATMTFAQDLTKFTDRKGKVGFNEGKKTVIEAKYDDATDFKQESQLAGAMMNGKWGVIDKTGKEVIPFQYDEIGSHAQGLVSVKKDGKWGRFDKTGKEIIPVKYKVLRPMQPDGSKLIVNEDNKWGLIDLQGREIIPAKYDQLMQTAINPGKFNGTLAGESYELSETGELLGGGTSANNTSSSSSSSSSSISSSAKKDECTYKCQACNKVVQYKCHAKPGDDCPVLTQKAAKSGGGRKGHSWVKQ